MTKSQRKTFLLLGAFSLLILALYILPNLHGAVNSEMLSVFQPDEYAQYPYLLHMLTNNGETFLQSVHTFLIYGHYYYGYPFYFLSGLVLLMLKAVLGSGWASATTTIVMVLRETINVLPMLLAILLLVWMQTRFKSAWRSLLLFVFLESLAAVVANNQWWHPDSLLVLFSILTLFFLQRDDLRFGSNFYLSAVTCGLSITSKTLGVLFFSTYLVYLIYGLITKKLSIGKAFGKAGIFLLVMAAAVVISMPQLLMPMERAEIIDVFKGNLAENSKGFWIISGGLAQNWSTFTGFISTYYSGWWIFLPALGFLIAGIFQRRTRLLALITATWLATYCAYFLFIAVTLRPHYFLPVFLPFLATMAFFWPQEDLPTGQPMKLKTAPARFWVNTASIVLLAGVSIANGFAAKDAIIQTTHEEANSPSIQFFNQVDVAYLSKLPADKNFTLYRDWRAYVAPRSNWNVVMNWDLADYSKMGELRPAVIFLESENIKYFSDAAKLDIALDETGMKLKYRFYTDAKNNAIDGYVLLAESSFGKAFARQDIYETYLKP